MTRQKSLLVQFVIPATLVLNGSIAFGQMGGGAPGGSAPAFVDPKFSDKLYENGGPQGRETKVGAIILSVSIEGNSSVSQNFILSTMQSREDRTFDKETLQRDINILYRTNLFKKITPYFTETADGVHVRLIVDERPIIKNVVYRGNQRLEDRQLSKHAGIQKGDPLDPISMVRKLRPDAGVPGDIVDLDGRVLGTHRGIIGFTIGQRRGLEIGGLADPLYVVRLDAARNEVIVGPRAALAVYAARLSEFNRIGAMPDGALTTKVRSTARPAPARIDGDRLMFDTPEYGVSPGQAAVLYSGERVVGGGWIEETEAAELVAA